MVLVVKSTCCFSRGSGFDTLLWPLQEPNYIHTRVYRETHTCTLSLACQREVQMQCAVGSSSGLGESARIFGTGPCGKQSYQDKVTEPKLGFSKDTVNVLEQEAYVTSLAFQGSHLGDSAVVRLRSREKVVGEQVTVDVQASVRGGLSYHVIKSDRSIKHYE